MIASFSKVPSTSRVFQYTRTSSTVVAGLEASVKGVTSVERQALVPPRVRARRSRR
jgi:hypothetical protein